MTTDDRVIRVFISSTFRDMMKERDLLVKQVFPALRRICAKRFVTFTEVDLRWGITEEQAAEGKVLPLCLAEIERSRPYFIGLLGERYGWIPDAIPAEVVKKEPWLKEHLHGRKSVTELEILHGVFNDPEMRGHSFFYFRDPAYVDNPTLTEEERREMVERDIPAEVEKFGPDEAARRTEERKEKLAALKQQIRKSGLPLVDRYESPEVLATLIEQQFEKLIDQLYPESDTPDPLDRERLAHEAHAKNKLFACIDRPTHLAALTAFAEIPEHGGKGLVVTGESGSGKTALLAAWAKNWATLHPEVFLFQHYFGATPDSASPVGFLRRLLGELKARFGITEEMPSQPDKLREALPLWLAQTVNKGRIVLILDGLNQVQGSDPDKRLNFLPRYFPPHVVVLASSLPGPALDALCERSWTKHDLPLADEGEVNDMVGAYLAIHSRALDDSLRRQLVVASGSKNPLFLRTLLEELRQFGSFEKLPDQVRYYLEADNPKELFLRVFRRWQADFDGKGPEKEKERIDLVRRALTHLWAAREGLSESEWLDLLGTKEKDEPSTLHDPFLIIHNYSPLPRAYWTPLFLALEPHLSQRSGLFGFGHDFIRQAVETAWLSDSKSRQAVHIALANYFETQPITTRCCRELSWALQKAEDRDRLRVCLLDICRVMLFNQMDENELLSYWIWLGEERSLGQHYLASIMDWESKDQNKSDKASLAEVLENLGTFLDHAGLYEEAIEFLSRAFDIHMQNPEIGPFFITLNKLAESHQHKGNYQKAKTFCQMALKTSESEKGPEHPDTLRILNNLGELIVHMSKDYVEAKALFQRVYEAREKVLGSEHHDTLYSLNDLAAVLGYQGDLLGPAGAIALFRRVLTIRGKVLGHEHPETLDAADNLSVLLNAVGGYSEAKKLCTYALKGRERIMGPEHPDTIKSVNNSAQHFRRNGQHDVAVSFYRRALIGYSNSLGPEHSSTLFVMRNLAIVLADMHKYKEAEQLMCQRWETFNEFYGEKYSETLESFEDISKLFKRIIDNARMLEFEDDYSAAKSLYELVLEGVINISRTTGNSHPYLQDCINNYVRCLDKLGHNQEQILAVLQKLAPELYPEGMQ
ncbi:MAG: tetratricopeptide repeat protein [Desulfuromonadaceae bacterium]|nr:tetratricopeptide repeat protein [Desulfuromonadaceae bacterium]